MVQVEIFTSKYDKYLKEAWDYIQEISEECGKENVQIKIIDIDIKPNIALLEAHIRELEKRAGAIENPIHAFPLFVVNNNPIIVGINPEFKKTMRDAIMHEFRHQ